jgi:hypothetical protein
MAPKRKEVAMTIMHAIECDVQCPPQRADDRAGCYGTQTDPRPGYTMLTHYVSVQITGLDILEISGVQCVVSVSAS